MLKLSKIYSTSPEIFPEIRFRDGLNVVYASVSKEVKDKKHSHSLGKTLLADLIDYMLIKNVGTSFFLKDKEVFKDLTFYLEICTSKNLYLTIKRPVAGKISIYSSNANTNILSKSNYSLIGANLGVDSARKELDNALQLAVVKGALGKTYRAGLRYCIRRQEEYLNIFKAKNVPEKDINWKPYLSGLLGINSDLVAGKYGTKDTIRRLKSAIKEIEHIATPQHSAAAMEAEITRVQKSTTEMSEELSNFSFQKIDQEITRELVNDVGVNIAKVNQSLYSVEHKLGDIEESLKASFDYDVEQVRELFLSIQISLPDQLVRTFEDLVALNQKMTHGRKEHLENAKEKLLTQYQELNVTRNTLNDKQENLSKLLVEKESFKKYKMLQSRLTHEESRLAVLQERLDKLDSATNLRARMAEAVREEEQLKEKLVHDARQKNNASIKSINNIFSELVKESLGVDAYFYLTINKDGNPHYQTGIADETSVDKGHSFNKIMAACFDIALLVHYSNSQYYRFSYHDGLLESLDDRVKLRLIDSWRFLAEKNKLQFIITVLDTDIPENAQGSKIYFKNEEIIRELHDKGVSGRLFKVAKF